MTTTIIDHNRRAFMGAVFVWAWCQSTGSNSCDLGAKFGANRLFLTLL